MTKAVKPTISHVLKAVQHLSTSVDGRFTETHEAILSLAEMTERRFDHIEGRLGNLESGMVTKDYLLVSNF